MIWFVIAIFILIVILLLFFAKIRVEITYIFGINGSHHLIASFFMLGFRIRQTNVDFHHKEVTGNSDMERLFIRMIRESHVHSIINNIKVNHFSWVTSIGTGDAASTGVSAGLLWTLKELSVYVMDEYLYVRCKPALNVKPIYQGVAFQTKVDCTLVMSTRKAFKIMNEQLFFSNNK